MHDNDNCGIVDQCLVEIKPLYVVVLYNNLTFNEYVATRPDNTSLNFLDDTAYQRQRFSKVNYLVRSCNSIIKYQ